MIAVNIRSQSEEIQYIRERFEMIDNKSVLCFNADLIVISVFFIVSYLLFISSSISSVS